MSPLDEDRLAAALALAGQAIGLSDPNPRVGCIIGVADGRILGQGHTQQAGGPHAEVMALRDAQSQGLDVRGATAWVTLEPCAHHGRTPPCCDALAAAGIAHVVVAVQDPFPQVAGQGMARLRAAGIEVTLADAAIAGRARELNIGFFSRFERGRPWVRLKVAMSLDGRTALENGVSQWITGEAARIDSHAWRRRASAILTGIGTVLADRPRMDVRLVPSALQPLRVVVDSHLRTPLDAPLLAPPGRCLVVAAHADPARADALRARGAEVLHCAAADGRVSLPDLLDQLARRSVNELHVEAGAVLNGAFAMADLIDEAVVYMAPTILGSGPGIAAFGPIESLKQARPLQLLAADRLGDDLRLRLGRRALKSPSG